MLQQLTNFNLSLWLLLYCVCF